MAIKLYNSLTRKLEKLTPIEKNHVKMYVCGPTVYDRAHLGNARSVVIYDVLYRLLKHLYPQVTYVRNITDVDDKIIKAAKERGITINQLTEEMIKNFRDDMAALNVLPPTYEPRATENIEAMKQMIQKLLDNENAYEAEGHVLFNVASYKDYGKLSNRSRDEMVAGARVEIAPFKKDPADFVLWKPANAGDDASSVFDSLWGKGRPGWHIECSAMSINCLSPHLISSPAETGNLKRKIPARAALGGDDKFAFDIHGGGADLMFPHHENEIAQSECATGKHYAKCWVHNGFLTVNGAKMSKSEDNFITVKELLDKGIKGEVIRYALLTSHYRSPLDWTDKLLDDAKKSLDYIYRFLLRAKEINNKETEDEGQFGLVEAMLCEDMNVTFALLSGIIELANHGNELLNLKDSKVDKQNSSTSVEYNEGAEYLVAGYKNSLIKIGKILGIFQEDPDKWFGANQEIETLAKEAVEARKVKDYATSDKIRAKIEEMGYKIEFGKDETYRLVKK